MWPKIIGALTGLVLAGFLFWNDLPFFKHNEVENLYNKAEKAYKDVKKSEDYIDAIEKYSAVLSSEALDKNHELYSEFNVLVNYKIALCYSDMAEREGQDGTANYDKAIGIITKELIDEDTKSPKTTVPEHQEGITYLWGHVLYKQGNYAKDEDQKKKYGEAEPKLRELINPNKFPVGHFVEDALYALGDINYSLKKYSEARKYLGEQEFQQDGQKFQGLLKKSPNSSYAADAQLLIAQSYLEENNFSKANEEFKKLISTNKANDEVKYRYANTFLRMGKDIESLQQYEDFAAEYEDKDPKSKFLAAAYFDMGNIYLKQAQDRSKQEEKQQLYKDAFDSFDKAIKAADNSEMYQTMIPRAKLGIAYSCYNKGKDFWDDALKNLPDCVELQSAVKELRDKIQNQQKLAENWDEFSRKFSEGLSYFENTNKETDENSQKELLNKSVDAYKEAIKYFNDKINDSSKQEDLNNCLYNLTLAYEKLGDWGEALTTYEKIPEGSRVSTHHHLLIAMSSHDEITDSLKVINDEDASENDKNAACTSLANLYPKVEDAYLKVINDANASESDKNVARINLAELHLETEPKRYAEAYDLYMQVKDDVEAQYMAIVCYYNQIQNKKTDAIDNTVEEVFRELKANNPNSELVLPAYNAMMQINEKFGEWSRMIELAEEIKKQFPNEEDIDREIKSRFPEADPKKVGELKESLDNINKLCEYAKIKQSAGSGVDDKISILREIIENSSDPTHKEKAKAQLMIGRLLYKVQQYEVKDEDGNLVGGAIFEYRKFTRDYSQFTSDVLIAECQIASCYYQLGQDPKKSDDEKIQYYKSVEATQAILDTLAPDENMQIKIHYLLGMAMYNMTKIYNKKSNEKSEKEYRGKAITHFNGVVRLEEDNDESSQRSYDSNLHLAQLYWDDKNYELASDKYLYLIKNNPDKTREDKLDKIDAYYHLGLCYGYLGDTANAETTFQNLWKYYNGLEEEMKQIGEVKEKIVDAGSRIAIFIADKMDTQELRDKAIGIVNQINGIIPQYENCGTDEEKYRRIQISHALGYIFYKSIEKFGSPPDEAITKFRKVIGYPNLPQKADLNADPFINEAYYFAGYAATILNHWHLAREDFLKKYVERNPNREYYQEARYLIARSYYEEKIYDQAIPLLEALIQEHPKDARLHHYLGNCYANVRPPRYLDALSKYNEVLNINPNHELAPAALREIMVRLNQIGNNFNEAVGTLTWLVNRHPAWAEDKHSKLLLHGIKKTGPDGNDTNEDIETDLDKVLLILDEEIVILYPDCEYAPQSYYNIGIYYSHVGYGYKKLYDQNPNSDDFANAIKNYRIAYDFFKKAYNHPKADKTQKEKLKNEIIYRRDNFVNISIDGARQLVDISAYNSVIYLCIDIASLFPELAAEMEKTLKNATQDVSISGIEDVRYKINSISDPNHNSTSLSHYEAGLQRLSLGNQRRSDYNLTPNIANKRELFLYATIDCGTAYDYFKKAYQHHMGDEQNDESMTQIQGLTDALVDFYIAHARLLIENTNQDINYQRDAINAYNIVISHLRDVRILFPDFTEELVTKVRDGINALPDNNWKSNLLNKVDEILR